MASAIESVGLETSLMNLLDDAELTALSQLPIPLIDVLRGRKASACLTVSAVLALVRLESLAIAAYGTTDVTADAIQVLWDAAVENEWIDAGPLTWQIAATFLRSRVWPHRLNP